jgi:transposase
VEKLSRIGMDTSKHIFQLHGLDVSERVVLRRKLRRGEVLDFFAAIAPTPVGLEASGGAHYWARELTRLGHSVRLIAPQYVRPYVKRGKNDAADAEAICEAMSRPTMRFVAIKSADNQAALMLAGMRDRLVRSRVRLANAIRGHAAEFGIVAAKGRGKIVPLLLRLQADEMLPALARELFAEHAKEYAQLTAQLAAIDARLMAFYRGNALSRRLARIPGVGPVIASLLAMKVPDPQAFCSGRQFAAWLGLTPKDHSTAGKTRLGVITRAGDETLRSLLVVGATAVIWQARRGKSRSASPWLLALLKRKPPKLAAVALANKIARIAWKLMATGEAYDARRALAATA